MAFDKFGKPTVLVYLPCPLCGYSPIYRKYESADSQTMDWIACAQAACTYSASFLDFRNTLSVPIVDILCPDCGKYDLRRQTKDGGGEYLGWVKCSDVGCPFEASFADVRALRP